MVYAYRSPGIEWGMAAAPKEGEEASGDQHVVLERPRGSLVAVLDGIGHGPEASEAARQGVAAVERYRESGAISLLRRCHEALIGTRGVVMSLAIFDVVDDTVTWLGVGNVAGVMRRADPQATPRIEEMLGRGGVVGLHLPMLQASVTAVAPGDVMVIATDGIRSGFADSFSTREPPTLVAERILREYSRGSDDALVVAARYVGRPGTGPAHRAGTPT